MVNWSSEQQTIIEKYKSLQDVPVSDRVYRCSSTDCKLKFRSSDLLPDGSCPNCKSKELISQVCPLDSDSGCTHTNTNGVEYCPICGELICPDCGSHDVSVSSRVTGYLSDTAGWNAGKRQEFLDRVRHTV